MSTLQLFHMFITAMTRSFPNVLSMEVMRDEIHSPRSVQEHNTKGIQFKIMRLEQCEVVDYNGYLLLQNSLFL